MKIDSADLTEIKGAAALGVKWPFAVDDPRAVERRKKERTCTNVTLCFSASQALLAPKADAGVATFLDDDANAHGEGR